MSQPVIFQRVESGFIFVLCLYFYLHLDFGLIWFILLLFSIDIFMLGYLINQRIGAKSYNVGHSYIIPSILIILGNITDTRILIGAGLIWAAHVGFDRMLGYGLKLNTGFQHTHLGDIGKK